MTAPIRVLLADDHAVVREGYRRLLESTGQVIVVAEAADADQAYAGHVAHAPDVTILDISLPGASGFHALARILGRDPKARVLFFSMHEDPVFVCRAMQGGAMGYLSKASAPENMLEAVLTLAEGRRYLPAGLQPVSGFTLDSREESTAERLSDREFEILRLMAAGRDATQIAECLYLSTKTVANYQTAIRHKLGARSLREVIHRAILAGLLPEASTSRGPLEADSGKTPLSTGAAFDRLGSLPTPYGVA